MSCKGDCFNIATPAVSAPRTIDSNPDLESIGRHRPDAPYMYSPLRPWQTRIIRLYPACQSGDGQRNEDQLEADMLVVDLLDRDLDGVTIANTSVVIEYVAISYTWDHSASDEVLVFGQTAKPISRSNTAMLKALRNATAPVHLWIDAICINQEDFEEKARQVSKMLLIYQKARSVTAWLGESDTNNDLAFACLSEVETIKADVDTNAHSFPCLERLQKIHDALLSLYNCRWLQRTWIRQEVYGARRLSVQCGAQRVDFSVFVQGQEVLGKARSLSPNTHTDSQETYDKAKSLLQEAQLNAHVPPNGIKAARKLTEVLLKAREFAVTEERDIIYATLGMCNVVIRKSPSAEQNELAWNAIQVDYSDSNSFSAVLRDASRCVMGREQELDDLADMWNSYTRSPLHAEGLPFWAVDWRSGLLSPQHLAAVEEGLQSYSGSTPLGSPSHWYPLSIQSTPGSESNPVLRQDWPVTLLPELSVVCAKVRILNYIACVTDLTCDVNEFLAHTDDKFQIGHAGYNMHTSGTPRRGSSILRNDRFRNYNPATDTWRLAILGVADNSPLCLVPSTARKGDLVAAIVPGMLPMLLHPTQGDGTAGGLFKMDDPYDKVPLFEPHPTVERYLSVFHVTNAARLCLTHISFTAALITVHERTTMIALSESYGSVLTVLIAVRLVLVYLLMMQMCTPQQASLTGKRFYRHWRAMELAIAFVAFTLFMGFGLSLLISSTGDMSFKRYIISSSYKAAQLLASSLIFLASYCYTLDGKIAVGVRRHTVLEHLDHVTSTIGRSYEFQGPLYVNARRPRYPCDSHNYITALIKKEVCRLVATRRSFSSGRGHVGMSQFDDLYWEIFVERRGKRLADDFGRHASNRPVQEVMLY